ncbi:CAF17-like 4Fe-4S cluster assembly/insertion protein YgfZ [Planctomicrobium sp. SH527]|uniref:CAF17-like 4Fe-4S cluster assembly/insertion protein YgfZ n=1 Tax=Planctomicrobium sp. SH527 TaxID=3448123 RepID=UPI003F5BF71A
MSQTFVFDLSEWTQIEMTGGEARTFLHNFCTNDIKGLTEGRRCEAFLCDIKGRILGHIQVLANAGGLHLISVPGAASQLVSHLTKYLLGGDVTFADRTSELGLFCVQGPRLGEILQGLVGNAVPVELGQCQSVTIGNTPCLVAATDMVPGPAVLISGERQALGEALGNAVAEAQNQLQFGAADLFERLRIEATFPKLGQDVGPENIAQEAARTAQAISFTKGCYLGQEPIARLDAMGHTNKELRRLKVKATGIQPGATVQGNGATVGTLTSVAIGEDPATSVALGVIRTKFAEPGTEVTVISNGEEFPAVVW